jgi:hypothetical protein
LSLPSSQATTLPKARWNTVSNVLNPNTNLTQD